jgi:hypothetical protein
VAPLSISRVGKTSTLEIAESGRVEADILDIPAFLPPRSCAW